MECPVRSIWIMAISPLRKALTLPEALAVATLKHGLQVRAKHTFRRDTANLWRILISTKNKRLLLLDGDIIVFQMAASSEKAIDWGDGLYTRYADAKTASENIDKWLSDLLFQLKADGFVIALSDPDRNNFRKDILPTYKAHRAAVQPPMIRSALEEYLRNKPEAKYKPTLEADDVLGILATNPKLYRGFDKIVVSLDKDLHSVPGKHFNWKKKDEGILEISLEDANRFHMLQTLAGDQSDGYTGCPGIGVKRAERMLSEWDGKSPSDVWPVLIKAFEKAGLGEDEALVQARVARILRHSDFDYKEQKPKLWHPKQQ